MNKNTKLEERMKEDQIASIGIGAMIVFIALILVAAVASAVIIQTGEKLQQNAQQTGSDTQEEIGGKINIITVWVGDQDDCDNDDIADNTALSVRDQVGDNPTVDGNNDDGACITLVYELAAGSEQMTEDQVHWSITCVQDQGTATTADDEMDMVYGTFDGFANNVDAYAAVHGNPVAFHPYTTMNLDTVNVDGTHKFVDDAGNGGDPDANDDDEDTLNPGKVYMITLKTSPDSWDDGGGGAAEGNDGDFDDVPELNQGECNPQLNEQHTLTINVVGGGTTIEVLSYTSITEGASVV